MVTKIKIYMEGGGKDKNGKAMLRDGIKRPKQHLQTRDPSWDMQSMNEKHIHLMVQVMESWFVADPETLANFYGQNFNRNAISKNNEVEKIEKLKIETALVEATKNTTKGKYHKIQHGAKILAIINPNIVRGKALYCDRFLKAIDI